MRMTVIKCFSLFVASGNSHRCNEMRDMLRNNLMLVDTKTGRLKVDIYKNGKNDPSLKESHNKICREVGMLVTPMIQGIPHSFFGPDIDSKTKGS